MDGGMVERREYDLKVDGSDEITCFGDTGSVPAHSRPYLIPHMR